MHARRFACMLLGFWLAGSMVMTFLYADSSQTASRILRDHSPDAGVRIKDMGDDEARLMLAYPVRLQARWWLEEWIDAELLLGAAFFFLVLFATREGKVVLFFALGMFALVLFQRFVTLPELRSLGNFMDLVPANVIIPERNRLTAIETAFIGVEIFKLLMGMGLGAYLIARTHRSSHSRD